MSSVGVGACGGGGRSGGELRARGVGQFVYVQAGVFVCAFVVAGEGYV